MNEMQVLCMAMLLVVSAIIGWELNNLVYEVLWARDQARAEEDAAEEENTVVSVEDYARGYKAGYDSCEAQWMEFYLEDEA